MVAFHLGRGTLRSWIASLCVLAALLSTGITYAADDGHAISLEQALQQAARQIIQELRQRGCRKVGVLKFRICTGREVSDSRGTLNSYLADRLETALVLANPLVEANQIRLVQQASAVASGIDGASHLSAPGRAQLFDAVYKPAWGRGAIRADAFVTGVAQVAPNFRTLRLSFLAVQPGDKDLEVLIKPIVAATNGAILNELGESYQLRGVNGAQSPADAVREVRGDPEANFPLKKEPAVTLRVFYDGQPVDFGFVDGEASIPEPGDDQNVSMQIERLDRGEGVYGAVLKVNGESVVLRQTEPDRDCLKYILKPDSAAISIPGYQLENDRAQRFCVAGRAESKALEVYYGRDVGTISLTVFREAAGPAPGLPPGLAADLPPDLAAIAKAGVPIEEAETLPGLQKQLREEAAGIRTRGVLKPGELVRNKVDWQKKRHWEPEPFLSAVIRYYRPQEAP